MSHKNKNPRPVIEGLKDKLNDNNFTVDLEKIKWEFIKLGLSISSFEMQRNAFQQKDSRLIILEFLRKISTLRRFL